MRGWVVALRGADAQGVASLYHFLLLTLANDPMSHPYLSARRGLTLSCPQSRARPRTTRVTLG